MQFHHSDGNHDLPYTPEEKRSPCERALMQTMRETNGLLTAREHRLETEWDEAEAHHDSDAMQQLEGLIAEIRGLRYNL